MTPENADSTTERILEAVAAAHRDAKAKGLGKGHGGRGVIDCPICEARLHYHVATINGHLWGICETKGCPVRWIE